MSFHSPLHIPQLRLKYGVDLRRARIDGAQSDAPYIGLENIESGTGRFVPRADQIESDSDQGSAIGDSLCSVFEQGDVLFGKLRPYLAKAWIAAFAGRCSTEILPLEPTKFDAEFLLYLLLSKPFIDTVDQSTFGSKMPRADWDFIGNVPVPCPDEQMQRATSSFLRSATKDIDTLIEAKQKLLGLLAEKRRTLVAEAVIRGLDRSAPLRPSGIDWLGDIPAHWEAVPLRFLISFSGGATPDTTKEDYWNGDIPWVSPKDMKRDFIADAQDHVSDLAVANSALKMIDEGAVLIVVRGMILAHSFPTAINTVPVTINQDMKALRCDDRMSPLFLKAVLEGATQYLVDQADSSAHGTKKLETAVLGALGIPLPPIEEQGQIVARIAEGRVKIDRLATATERSIGLLKERRSALIAAAVTGQIAIPEAA